MRLLVAVAMGLLAGCVYDDSEICGPHMRFDAPRGVCECEADAIPDEGACTVCPDGQVVDGAVCECIAGQTKDATGVCAPSPGLGSACDATNPCDDATYDYCAERDGVGSCTSRCTTDAGCPGGFVCADWESQPSCRTYTGVGATCAGQADCAAFDATFCIQGACVVQGCTIGVDDCPRDMGCCDLSAYGAGTLCVPPGTCP